MSVGKTTLVNALKELPEFKDYHFRTERSKHLMNLGIPLNTDSTLKGQLVFASERAAELMQEKIITDRTVIDVMAFCDLSESMKDHEKFYLNAALYYLVDEYDILFYVSPEGVEIEDNGIRETNAEYRDAIDEKIKEYYLNGIEYDYDTWNEIMKGKEGLPWYKQAAAKGQTHRN